MNYFLIGKNIFAVIGALFTVHRIYKQCLIWKEERAELQRKEGLLRSSDYFLARIIHIGGEFSHVHSLAVYSNEEGGYYLNPPEDFVSVSFNRGGDSIVVTPSSLSEKFSFKIEAFGQNQDSLEKSYHSDICHLQRNSLKNEWYVKFVKSE